MPEAGIGGARKTNSCIDWECISGVPGPGVVREGLGRMVKEAMEGQRGGLRAQGCLVLLLLLCVVGRGVECAGEVPEESSSGDGWWEWDFWKGLIPGGWQDMFNRGSTQEGTKVLSEAEILMLEAPRMGVVAAVRVELGAMTNCEVGGELYCGSVGWGEDRGWYSWYRECGAYTPRFLFGLAAGQE